MNHKYNEDVWKIPLNEIFIEGTEITYVENKQLYKAIPTILSGNKPSSQILDQFKKLKPEVQEAFFDIAVYSLLTHYTSLSTDYDCAMKNTSTSVVAIREDAARLLKDCLPEFNSFLLSDSDPSNDKVNNFIRKSIEKVCNLNNPGHAQYFSTTMKIFSCLDVSKNNEIERRMHYFFKQISEPLFLGMLIVNKVANNTNLKHFLKNPTECIFKDKFAESQIDHLSDHKKGMLSFLGILNQYSPICSEDIGNFISSHSPSILFESSIFENTIKSLNNENKKTLWNNNIFQEKIKIKLNSNEFFILNPLQRAFTDNLNTRMDEPLLQLLHSQKEIQPLFSQNEETFSFKIFYADYFSAIINNRTRKEISEFDDPDMEIQTSFSYLSALISSHMLKNNYIEEFSLTEHKSYNNPAKNGATLSFSNSQLQPEAFMSLIKNISNLFTQACLNTLPVPILPNQPLPKNSKILPIIDIYYEEAYMLSQSSHNFSKGMKPKKF